MNIFVTGASGFVGSHVSEQLTAVGHTVSAMARSDRSAEKVQQFGATPVRCELGAVEPQHLEGIDVIVHCAAFVEEYGTREQFWSANVDGTTQLLDAARAAGVKRFVHIGTEAAVWDGSNLIDADEQTPYPERHRFLYSESKAAAEQRVLAANGPGFTTVSVRPCFVWGPRDNTLLPAIRRMVEDGGWVWLDGGRALTSTTHVLNLVEGVRLVLTADVGGEAFFVSDDEETTMREFVERLVATEGLKLPSRSAPSWLVVPVARLMEGTWRLFGAKSTPPLTDFAVSAMSRDKTVNVEKAKRVLGWKPVISVSEGIAGL